MVRRFTLVITGCLLAIALNAQEIWSLERCIRHAIDNSLLVQSSVINRDFAVVADQQAREARFPNLNVSGSAGLNFGRVVNPATNDFETENSLFNNWGLNTGMILFNSGAVNKSIRQSRLDLEAGNQDLQQTKNDIALQVALAYLNVLFADENVTNGRNTLTLSESQLEQTDKMIAAGVIPEADRYDILAQIALDEQAIVDFVNAYDNAMLSLKHLLLLEPGYPMQIEKPEIDLTNQERLEASSLETVYNAAYARQPEIQAQALRVESALLGEQIAQTQLYPRLTIGGSLGTSYSDLAKQALGFERQRVPIPDVYINGELVQYEVEQDVATGVRTTPYGTQLDN
ncbi:MAG: TolC family protein, partial [Saprospiraceae bacterium]|nr:TolC family protein [Saprospiraceae bacterium]